LASNIGTTWLDSGSGIYSKGNYLNYTFQREDKNNIKLIIAKVGIISSENSKENSNGIGPSNSWNNEEVEYNVPKVPTFLEFSPKCGSKNEIKAVHNNLTCHAYYQTSHNNCTYENITYALMALDGFLFDDLLQCKICAIVYCPTGNCMEISLDGDAMFEQLSLWGNFGSKYPIFPIVGTRWGYLEQGDRISWSQDGKLSVNGTILNAVLYTYNG
jgi:hypothetical protein